MKGTYQVETRHVVQTMETPTWTARSPSYGHGLSPCNFAKSRPPAPWSAPIFLQLTPRPYPTRHRTGQPPPRLVPRRGALEKKPFRTCKNLAPPVTPIPSVATGFCAPCLGVLKSTPAALDLHRLPLQWRYATLPVVACRPGSPRLALQWRHAVPRPCSVHGTGGAWNHAAVQVWAGIASPTASQWSSGRQALKSEAVRRL
jgi:hypothetical protein